MTIIALLLLSQIADMLSFPLALGHGVEGNPIAAAILASFGLWVLLGVKGVAAVTLAIGAYALPHRRTIWLWLAFVGFVGCFTNLLAAL